MDKRLIEIFIILSFTIKSICQIQSLYSIQIDCGGGSACKFFGFHTVGRDGMFSILALETSQNIQYLFLGKIDANFGLHYNLIDLALIYNSTEQIRMTPYTIFDGTNNTFIFFTSRYIKIWFNNFADSIEINIGSNQYVLDTFFETNQTTKLFTVNENTGFNYSLQYYEMFSHLNTKFLPIESSETYVTSVQSNGLLYLLFKKGIYIFRQNQSMDLVHCIPLSNGASVYNMEADQKILVYTIDSRITVVDTDSFVDISHMDIVFEIDDVAVKYPFIYILTNNSIIQFDTEINKSISTSVFRKVSPFSSTNWRLSFVNQDIIHAYQVFPFYTDEIMAFNFSFEYPYNNITCLQGYGLTPSNTCRKDYSQNQTQNASLLNESSQSTQSTQLLVNFHSNIDKTIEVMGKFLTFSAINISPTFIKSLFLFVDDWEYYQYHRIDYPDTIKFFMNKVNILYEFRVNPWFLKYIDIFNQIQTHSHQKTNFKNFLIQHKNNPDNLYFLSNTHFLYINNFLLNIFLFFLVKCIAFLLFLLKKKFRPIRKQYSWIKNNTKWWSLLTMIIETNLVLYTFNCCLQFVAFVCLDIQNKINNIIASLVFFIVIFYSTMFYPIVYLFEKEKSAQTLLKFSNFGFKSFYFQSYCFLVRSVVRGIIQGTLFRVYFTQMICLICLDMISALVTLFFWKQFRHRLVFILVFLYNFLFFIFDLGLLFLYRIPNMYISFNYELGFSVLIWLIIVTYLLFFLLQFALNIYELFFPMNKFKLDQQNKLTQKINKIIHKNYQIDLIQKKSNTDSSNFQTRKTVKSYQQNTSFIPVEQIKMHIFANSTSQLNKDTSLLTKRKTIKQTKLLKIKFNDIK